MQNMKSCSCSIFDKANPALKYDFQPVVTSFTSITLIMMIMMMMMIGLNSSSTTLPICTKMANNIGFGLMEY